MAVQALKDVYGFLRWRLIPVRQLGKVRRSVFGVKQPAVLRSRAMQDVQALGYASGPALDAEMLKAIQAIYRPRTIAVVPTSSGHPFTNLFSVADLDPANPVLRYALSPEVLDAAQDYFGGRFLVDSVQVLYSWPTGDRLDASQYWHKDYGDNRSLHCMVYLNDVLDDGAGPFAFVDRNETRKIGHSLAIRRIDDATFAKELGNSNFRRFLGKAGDVMFVDPSQCYHYGSRCETPRLALFVTFNTDRPFVGPVSVLQDNARKAADAAKQVRPDLNPAFLDRIFGA
jgi:hypothetical protein